MKSGKKKATSFTLLPKNSVSSLPSIESVIWVYFIRSIVLKEQPIVNLRWEMLEDKEEAHFLHTHPPGGSSGLFG